MTSFKLYLMSIFSCKPCDIKHVRVHHCSLCNQQMFAGENLLSSVISVRCFIEVTGCGCGLKKIAVRKSEATVNLSKQNTASTVFIFNFNLKAQHIWSAASIFDHHYCVHIVIFNERFYCRMFSLVTTSLKLKILQP